MCKLDRHVPRSAIMENVSNTGTHKPVWVTKLTATSIHMIQRLLLTLFVLVGLAVLCIFVIFYNLWRALRRVIPVSIYVLLSPIQYTLTWLLWMVQLARWDLLIYKLVAIIVMPAGFWHLSGALIMGPLQVSVRPLVKAVTLGLWTAQALIKAQLTCMRWSASWTKSIAFKVMTPAGFWHREEMMWQDESAKDMEEGNTDEDTEFEDDEEKKCPKQSSYPEWMLEDRKNHRDVLKQYNTKLSLYKKIPNRALSRAWGCLNQQDLPMLLKLPVLKAFMWLYSCKQEEMLQPDLNTYSNLSQFFQRKLLPDVRPIDNSSLLTSPADGKVLYCGTVQDGVVEQVKGVTYSMQGFLGPPQGLLTTGTDTAGLSDKEYGQRLKLQSDNELFYIIIYLGPGDYHRFHSPTDWTVLQRRHFPGELFSVKPSVARWLQGLFNFNERAAYTGRWQHGFFSMTAVGATNVGSISVYCDKDLATNRAGDFKPGYYEEKQFDISKKRGVKQSKGDMFGDFNFGSTIVLMFEAPKRFKFSVKPGQSTKVGQGLGSYVKKCSNGRRR